ncbi:hypothetical protein OSB04_027084 [Centaurea solstitialis]|uniref:Protein ALP1-like n=1 Tax=Centaurea solstitialis TaxID=347529 RepID=A0AA38SY45_9ASTR|nr:hypothetical protein OSB04_027084 [Centaurea solstitialis]
MSSDESDEERIHQHFRVAGGLLMEAARIIIHNEIIEPSTKRTRGPHKNRDREEGHDKLFADYFSDNPVYNDNDFSRRFRMTRRLFLRIVGDLENEFDFFKQGVKGFSPIQKCTSVMRHRHDTDSTTTDDRRSTPAAYRHLSYSHSRSSSYPVPKNHALNGRGRLVFKRKRPGAIWRSLDCRFGDARHLGQAPVFIFIELGDARLRISRSPSAYCVGLSAIRQLAYGTAADYTDEYLRMSETTSRECLSQFCKGIIRLYMRQYLRKPTASDIQAIYALHENVYGLPTCLVPWIVCIGIGKIVPSHGGVNTIEGIIAVASYDQWIWHAFFGVPGATNDIIVVNQSPIFNDIFDNKAPDSSFVVNGTQYKHGYYLVDGIYPEWSTFVKAFSWPSDDKRMEFKTRQESARKDIERTFATLKDKWHVVKYLARVWSRRKLCILA